MILFAQNAASMNKISIAGFANVLPVTASDIKG